MSVDDQALASAAETTRRYRAAIEAGDTDAFLQTLAPDVVLHSPITARTRFCGHDEIRVLMGAVFSNIEDIRYFEDVGDATTRALFYRGRVGRQEVEEATLVRLDSEALITEIRLWFRPLPGLTAVMRKLGPALAREHGRGRSMVAAALAAPLAAAASMGDALAISIVRPGGGIYDAVPEEPSGQRPPQADGYTASNGRP